MLKRWFLRSDASNLEFKTNDEIRSFMLNLRNVSQDGAESFLNPNLSDLPDIDIFSEAKLAIELVEKHKNNQIWIFGDYDVDGLSATAIMELSLKEYGCSKVDSLFPIDRSDSYGLNSSRILSNQPKGPSLVITVDNGLGQSDHISSLKEAGFDVLVIDHHKASKDSPADCVLSPDRIVSQDNFTPFCASGISYIFSRSLLGADKALRYLSLSMLGTLADVVALTGANRIIVSEGLKPEHVRLNLGVQALVSLVFGSSTLNSEGVLFQINPRINAAGRVESCQTAFNLLTTDSLIEATNISNLLSELNKERRQIESEHVKSATSQVDATHHFSTDRVVIVDQENWHPGVIGIVASRLVEKYCRPTLVISRGTNVAKGSARTYGAIDLHALMSGCSDLFNSFGGHAAACGFEIQSDKISQLRKRLNDLSLKSIKPEMLVKKLMIDAEISSESLLQEGLYELVQKMKPFGAGNPKPLFAIKQLTPFTAPVRRKDGWHMDLKTDSNHVFHSHSIRPITGQMPPRIDCVFTPEIRAGKPILSIEDLRASAM